MTAEEIRDRFLSTLNHVEVVSGKIRNHSGGHRPFTFPDQHKLVEGLFLNCWTHWEGFIRELLLIDLASAPAGFVRRDVRTFRVKGAPLRLAEAVLSHPDHPNKFVEWDFTWVRSRANTFLPAGHRFAAALPRSADLERLKRIRNAIAHKSDRAWSSFLDLVRAAPFSLPPAQMKGITVGRFIAAHVWNGHPVLEESIFLFRALAGALVP